MSRLTTSEAIEEETSVNELQHSWQKTMLTAVVAPAGRYRYEGRSGYGAAVCPMAQRSGRTTYTYMNHLYTQHPAPPQYPTSGSIIPHEEMSTMTAAEIKGEISGRAHRLKSATLLPHETISGFSSHLRGAHEQTHAHVTFSTYLGRAVPHENQIS